MQTLPQLVRKYLQGRAAFEEGLRAPLLVWEAATVSGQSADEAYWERTGSGSGGGGQKTPSSTGPVIFTVEKSQSKANAFALGVTVGRVATNDVVIDDESVSRFHAFIQRDERRGIWTLSDAESRNGSFVGDVRAQGSERLTIADGSVVRFGKVSMRFMLPATFLKWVEAQLGKK